MTREELARFWDVQLRLWFQGLPLSRELDAWRRAYDGELQEWAFPEPFIGDLLGSPRIVLLANNPGVAHEELQSRNGVFGRQIVARGFTAWAATRPFEGPESEWEKRFGPIAHNRARLEFARRFLGDQSIEFDDLLNVELYPWHSPRLTRPIRVQPETLRRFVLEPLAEFGRDVPVVALGKAWADALDRTPNVIEGCQEFTEFHVPSRRARRYKIKEAGSVLVVWHSGSDKPPAAEDSARLREIWFDLPIGEGRMRTESHVRPAGRHARPRTTRPRESVKQPRAWYESADQLAATIQDETVRPFVHSLPEWIAEEFQGQATAVRQPTGQFRLRILGEFANIGWDFKQEWIWVWVNKPLPGDRAALESALSYPLGNLAPPKLSFRVQSDSDAQALQALIRRHVAARSR